MEGEIKRERASTNVPGDVPVIEGVPPAFFEFLSAQLTRFEASFGARLSAIEESIRATNTRIDETQRSIRKLKRSISQDLTHSLNTPSGGDYPLVSERSSDTLSPRKASRAVRIHFGILMMLCTPEEANYLLTSFIFWFFFLSLLSIASAFSLRASRNPLDLASLPPIWHLIAMAPHHARLTRQGFPKRSPRLKCPTNFLNAAFVLSNTTCAMPSL